MAFAGLRGTGSWGTDERPKNFREYILWANPNGQAPLTALLSKMRKEGVDDPEFAWFEETLQAIRVQINWGTNYLTSDETLTISSGGLSLVAGDVLQVEKTETSTYNNEILVVSAVTSDTVIVCKRGQANTARDAILDDVYMTKIGSVFEEGSLSPNISQRNPTKLFNYAQIFKTAVGLTNTAAETKARTGDAYTMDKKRKSFDHSTALELAFLYGQKYEDLGGTFPMRYTGGLRSFLATNVTIFTTTPTEDTFLNAVMACFNYTTEGSGDERIGFCGNGFLNSLNKIARNSSRTNVNFDKIVDLYGMKLASWTLPQGTIALKTHPLMNTHPRYTNACFIIAPSELVYRPLRDTKFKDNIQANDADQRKGQWLSEVGLEVHHEETMAYISNFVV